LGRLSRNTMSCGYGYLHAQGRRCWGTCALVLAAYSARVLQILPPPKRAWGMPGAQCTRSRACSVVNTRVSHHGYTGSPGIPARNGFNGFLRGLPGDRACLPPSFADCSATLTPASGCQDHTTSPSASAPFVKGASASTASRPASVTIAIRPSSGTRRNEYRSDLGLRKIRIFFVSGLDFDFAGCALDLPVG
jgi:hypothetical protein